VLPEGEEKVYVDDRTGNTYVVTDDGRADPNNSGRVGRLSRRLSDNQRWLDGLSDQEYDDYMVSILDLSACCINRIGFNVPGRYAVSATHTSWLLKPGVADGLTLCHASGQLL
jgi:hypothetical protein